MSQLCEGADLEPLQDRCVPSGPFAGLSGFGCRAWFGNKQKIRLRQRITGWGPSVTQIHCGFEDKGAISSLSALKSSRHILGGPMDHEPRSRDLANEARQGATKNAVETWRRQSGSRPAGPLWRLWRLRRLRGTGGGNHLSCFDPVAQSCADRWSRPASASLITLVRKEGTGLIIIMA